MEEEGKKISERREEASGVLIIRMPPENCCRQRRGGGRLKKRRMKEGGRDANEIGEVLFLERDRERDAMGVAKMEHKSGNGSGVRAAKTCN